MSVIRQDPTTKEWVILATDRSRRPHDFVRRDRERTISSYDPACPFCPGNEHLTPSETYRYPASREGQWAVRVVPNKFAALSQDGQPKRSERDHFFREMTGVGLHEVIIETARHDRVLPLMEDHEVEQVLKAYQVRYAAARKDARVKYIIIFKNHGETAGTSLEHSHSQLVATPVAPSLLRRKYEVAAQHYDDTGRCLYCDLVEAERDAKVRVVWETAAFTVFHPYASRVPFETWIAPNRHRSSFGQATAEELAELALVLRRVLRGLYRALGNPDFNYMIHSAPVDDENKDYYLWHLQILPRVTTIAGFELGSGIFITTMVPEESAPFMHEVMKSEAGA